MIYEEKTVSSNKIFEGRIIKVRVDNVLLPDGVQAERELVEHPGGVGVVAVTDNDEIVMVKQYRKPLEKVIYEIPAGKLDSGENHRECGLRELGEETGMTAGSFEYLGFIYPSPGFTDEMTHIYLATELSQGESCLDDDEYLDVERIPIDRVYEMILNNEINDAKTVCGILRYMNRRIEEKR